MNLKKILTPDSIAISLQAESKSEVIEELVDILAKRGKVKNRAAVLTAIQAREEKMSTGMQNGVAIPHAKTDTIDSMAVLIAFKKEGISFDSLDGAPSTIFIMTVSPENRVGPHIQFLAEISKLLSRPELREQLLAAQSKEAVLALLTT